MKKVQKYVCDICCNEYETEKECLKCEKSHAEVEKVIFDYGSVSESKYPHRIHVNFKDGIQVHYRRV